MPDETLDAPGSSAPGANSQQAPAPQKPASSGIPEGYVPEARLTGALQKIQELTLTNQSLQGQLIAANTANGQLQAQGSMKETEWSSKAGETANTLKSITDERDVLKAKIATLELEGKKLKMIADTGHFNLLAIADQIPVQADPAKQKEAIERMAAFAASLVNGREKELTAGETALTIQPIVNGGELPTTSAGWNKAIDALPFGTPERQAMFDKFFEWSTAKPPVKA